MFSKARRSFGISIGILLLGFMAIGIALVYRVMRDSPPPAVAESVMLEPGAQVVSAVVSDGVINVTYIADGWTVLALFDQATGTFMRRVVLKEFLSAAMPPMPSAYLDGAEQDQQPAN